MPLPSTMTPIATNTLTTATASVTFSSIPQGYTDLVLICNSRTTSGTPTIRLQFNSDTGSNYSTTLIYGDGSSGGSVRVTNEASTNSGGLAGEFGSTIINLNNYSNSTTYKIALSRYGFLAGYSETGSKVSLWRNTSAITSILVFPASSTFTSGCTLTLYGIKAA